MSVSFVAKAERFLRIYRYVKFVSPCPVCKNNDNNIWFHLSHNSPLLLASSTYFSGDLVSINKEGNIKCNNPNCYYNKHPMFIMDWEFNCYHHGGFYSKPGKTQAINAIHVLCKNLDFDFDHEFEDNISLKILNYKN